MLCHVPQAARQIRRVIPTPKEQKMMKHIALLGLALMVVLAFGVVAAATASAEEIKLGLLFLPKEEGPVSIKGGGGKLIFSTPAGKLECEKTEIQSDPEKEQEKGTHITLIKVHWHLLTCKNGSLSCSSGEAEGKKDTNGEILILLDIHFVDLEEVGTKILHAGIAFIILNTKHEVGEIVLTCGVAKVLVKGAVLANLKASLTADATSGAAAVPVEEKLICHEKDELCKKIVKELPFLFNFKGTFEAATVEAESSIETGKMVLIDD
jgi:hypothetical protein